MVESIIIPYSHIQNMIDDMPSKEITSRLTNLQFLLLKIQLGNDQEPGEYEKNSFEYNQFLIKKDQESSHNEYLNNEIRRFSYDFDNNLFTIYTNIKSCKGWIDSASMSSFVKNLGFAYHKNRALHKIRLMVDNVKGSSFARSQNLREQSILPKLGQEFYHGYDYFPNYFENNYFNMSTSSYLEKLIYLSETFVDISTLQGHYVNVKKIYNDINIRKCFQGFAWVSIVRPFRKLNLYRDILKRLLSSDKKSNAIGLQYMDKGKLCNDLCEMLQKNKCLIVFSKDQSVDLLEVLDAFKFPMRSKIFLMTKWWYEVSKEDVLALLQSIALPIGRPPGPELTHILPVLSKKISQIRSIDMLRITTRIGVVLRNNYSIDHVAYTLSTLSPNRMGSLKIVSLCYDYLPTHLKECFLYLGQFWEDEDINAEMLYQMWIAEGMVLPYLWDQTSKTLMDMAEDNLFALANRFLIDVKEHEFSTARKFVSCRIDKSIKEFCWRPKGVLLNDSLAVKETAFGFESSSRDGFRLSLKIDLCESQLLEFDIDQQLTYTLSEASNKLRSLIIQKSNDSPTVQISFPLQICNKFKLLKVLKINNFEIRGGNLPEDIRNLRHLRFLSLEGSIFEELPKSLGKFQFIQSLDLRVAENIPRGIIVPNVLLKLKELRHLYLPTCHQLSKDEEKLSLSGLDKLETLVNIDAQKVELASLEWKNLWKIDATVHGRKNMCDMISYINESGAKLKETFLHVCFSDQSYEESDVPHEDVSNCSKLNHFMVTWGRWDSINTLKIPSPFSSNVIELCLARCQIRDDPMPILGKFPFLKKLVLGKKAFMGTCLIFEEGSFPTLRYLKIQGLIHLEKLEIRQGSMPCLLCLEIICCLGLKMIPVGLVYIERLTELKLCMPKEFNDKIRRGDENRGEDLHIVEHVQFIFLEDWS